MVGRRHRAWGVAAVTMTEPTSRRRDGAAPAGLEHLAGEGSDQGSAPSDGHDPASTGPGATPSPEPPGPSPARRRPGPDPQRAPVRFVARTTFLLVLVVALSLTLQVTIISGLQHQAAQTRAFASLRGALANGTAPVAQADADNRLLPLGTPVALIEIPSLDIREVVGEGTTPGVLMAGPGHRRDTPMPGQAGTSVIFGRAGSYGGPFKRLDRLAKGATITVTTGQGVSEYKVIGERRAGDPRPPPPGRAKGRLQLVTATGAPFVPSGVLRIDADLSSETLATPPLGAGSIPKSEQPLGTDQSTAWALVLWLQALILVAVSAVWSWSRWGRHQTWIVFLPLAGLAGLGTSGQLLHLLPNLL